MTGPLEISLKWKIPNFCWFISHPLTHNYLTNNSRVVAISCSLDSIFIISLMQWTNALFMEGKNDQDSWTLLCLGLESWCILRKDSAGVLLAFPTESKLLWWGLSKGMEKEAFVRSIATYLVPGEVLICSSNETTPGQQLQVELLPG